MNYHALFGIDGGVSPGFGVTYPDYIEETKNFDALSSEEAYAKALGLAARYALDHLSNPDTGETMVKIILLRDPAGEPISQKDLSGVHNVEFENGCTIVRASFLEKLLAFSGKDKKE